MGAITERRYAVEARHAIEFAGGNMPAVLCTPALIGFLERTAREALTSFLEPGENSVGTQIEVNHLAPTPPGFAVTCTARVIHVEGPRVTFQVEARDERELIARGVHERRVIREERFAAAVARKLSNA